MSIKLSNARTMAATGRYPQTWEAVLAVLPASTVTALTARQLAELADAVRASWDTTKALAEAEVVAEGLVWDARAGRSLPIGA